jgi:uncharacterized membrane protein YfcA
MEYLIISVSSFLIAGLSLFSGFGLGTVLMPIFILFFAPPIAISLTAIVHFLNNIFKFFILGNKANKEILVKFGIPSVIGAILGSLLLALIVHKNFDISYNFFNMDFQVEFINLIIGVLILGFVLIDIMPLPDKISVGKEFLPLGGILSGFFGGLSGNQGVFRSIFLLKCNLTSEQFIATGVILACIADSIRLCVYGVNFLNKEIVNNLPLLTIAVLSAFLGSYISRKFIKRVTIDSIRKIVFVLLVIISLGLISGTIK